MAQRILQLHQLLKNIMLRRQTLEGLPPEHDIFKQLMKLQNTLRHMMGEDLITHLGLDYYQELVESL